LRLPFTELPDKQRTVVSDTQLLASHDVTPTIIMTVNEFNAKLDPSSVMLIEPVLPKLDFSTLAITAVSAEKAIVWVWDRSPTVMERRLLPFVLRCTLHCTEESDFHEVTSHTEKPILAETVLLTPAVFNSDPKMVTNTCPVAGEFGAFVNEIVGKSAVKNSDRVERAVPLVMVALRVPLTLELTMPFTCTSEIHIVASHVVFPIFNLCVTS